MHTKLTLTTLAAASLLLMSGCGNTAPSLPGDSNIAASSGDFVYEGHNFGPNRSEAYKAGAVAGCRTSSGDYTKDHTLFKTSEDYHAGWEHGRLHCKGKDAVTQ